ncbi:MAG TPA: phosphate ABC transporter substrate-binding protein PstS [Terriglobales bacterium]|nr:phosphate ABC transporter substrate-binding protein PstS [Terriglobales bacterium]
MIVKTMACCSLFLATLTLAQQRIALVGSGSNVPSPLYAVWIDDFNKKDPGVQVRYLPLGTAASIQQISVGSGDFGGGEIILSREEMQGKVPLMQIPTVLVGIVPIYNLPGDPEVNFSGDLLAQIFLGKITNWKDSRLAKLNPKHELPDMQITVVHRAAGKGSNYIFTDFLSKSSSEFHSKIGKSPSPHWPLGLEANRGEDMVSKVAATQGALGYVEWNFAKHSGIGYGAVENTAGQFVRASTASIAAACKAMETSIPNDFRISLVNAPGKDVYPIASFTWIYVPASDWSSERGRALKAFLSWALDSGQSVAEDQGYAVLPHALQLKAQAAIDTAAGGH